MAGPQLRRTISRGSDDGSLHERSPLLATAAAAKKGLGNNGSTDHDDEDRPLPMGQLFLICYARLVEPVAFFSIFPFVSQYIFETGISKEQTGFFTGLIESLFSLVQFIVMPFWGRFSDKMGRKPILIASLFSLAVTSTLFGISRNVWMMIVFRVLSGFASGSTVTLRTMTSEISTPKTQAFAFAGFALSGNLSIFLAPLMGGLLSKPAESFPGLARVQLFIEYPYLLPCMVTGALALSAAIVNLLFLEETLKPHDASGAAVEAPSSKEIFAAKGVKTVLIINWYTFSIAFMYTALSPTFQWTPIDLGGYGLSPRQISYLLGIGGASQAFWTLLFPSLHRRFGSVGLIRWASWSWPIFFCIYPAMNFALRRGLDRAVFWAVSAGLSIFGAAISMSFTSCQLCVNDISPSPSALGTLNGIVLSGTAATRAVAPGLISSIFATGVERHILWGQLAWFTLFWVAIGYFVVVRHLPREAWGLVDSKPSSLEDPEEA